MATTPTITTGTSTSGQAPQATQAPQPQNAPVTLDMSTAQPLPGVSQAAPQTASQPQNAPVTLDMSTAQPLSGAQPDANNPLAITADTNHTMTGAVQGLNSVGAGIGEGVLNTLNNVDSAAGIKDKLHTVLEERQAELARNNAQNPIERTAGKIAEQGAETAGLVGLTGGIGDAFLSSLEPAALDGVLETVGNSPEMSKLPASVRLSKLMGVAKTFEEHPVLQKIAQAGVNALRYGAVGTAQGYGDTGTESGGLIGGLAGLGGGIIQGALTPLVTAPPSLDAIQPALHEGIRDAVNSAAEELGVTPSNNASIRSVAEDVGQAAKTKAQGIYRQLDNAAGGTRFQEYANQLNDAQTALRSSISEADADAHGALIETVNNLEAAKDKAYQAVKDAGLDPDNLYKEANNLWKRGSAIQDVGANIQKSVSGTSMNPNAAVDASKAKLENVSTTKLFGRLNQMYTSGRLKAALGEQKANELLQTVDTAHLQAEKLAAQQAAHQLYQKGVGKAAAFTGKLGAYAALGASAYHHYF